MAQSEAVVAELQGKTGGKVTRWRAIAQFLAIDRDWASGAAVPIKKIRSAVVSWPGGGYTSFKVGKDGLAWAGNVIKTPKIPSPAICRIASMCLTPRVL